MENVYVVAIAREARTALSIEEFRKKLDTTQEITLVDTNHPTCRARVSFEGTVEELYGKLGYTREQVHIETVQRRYPSLHER